MWARPFSEISAVAERTLLGRVWTSLVLLRAGLSHGQALLEV